MALPLAADLTTRDRSRAMQGRRGLLERHLQRLRKLPGHGNRALHYDQLFLALLLAFFEPLCRSLRTIESSGDFGGRIDLPRCARSTTADALAVFDPTHLKPIIDDLRQRIPDLGAGAQDLEVITRQIIAADGTYLNTLVDVAWALKHTKSNRKRQAQVRANVQLDVASFTPAVISISGDDQESEPAAFARDLLSGVLYVMDRNFLDFSFLKTLLAKQNDLVLRVRSNSPAMRVVSPRHVTAADAEAGVVSDEQVVLTGRNAPAQTLRRVVIQTTNRKGEQETIRLLSSLTGDDVAARVIGAIYRQRWQIELFFKWLKTWARMDHLLSTSRNGITFQFYVAMIAVLMMHVQSGRRVSIYCLHLLSRVAHGQMSMQQAMAVLAKFERERELDRARQARKRARKKLAQ